MANSHDNQIWRWKIQGNFDLNDTGIKIFNSGSPVSTKALHYKLFFVKALSKQLWKLTKLMKQLIVIIIVSFVNR